MLCPLHGITAHSCCLPLQGRFLDLFLAFTVSISLPKRSASSPSLSSPQTFFFLYPYSLLVSHQGQVHTEGGGMIVQLQNSPGCAGWLCYHLPSSLFLWIFSLVAFWWCRLRGSVILLPCTLLLLAVAQRCDYCEWRCPAQNSAWASSQETGCQRQIWDHPFPCSWEEGEEIHGEQKEWEEGKVYQGPDVQKGKHRAGTDSMSPSAIFSW